MKKINFIITGLIALLLFSCNPNKEVYEELDAQRVPFHQSLSYTLTEDDYTTIKSLAQAKAETHEDSAIANDIATYLSFSKDRPADNYIPDFLANKFIALDSASSVTVGYNYDNIFMFTNEMKFYTYDTLTVDQVINILNDTIDSPQEGDFILAKYYYTSSGVTERIYNLFQYDGTTWTEVDNFYMLTDEDYDAMDISAHHFDVNYDPGFYVPKFMNNKFVYSNAGDSKHIVYKYMSNNVNYYYDNLIYYNGTSWTWNQEKTDQYLHNGEKWVFDPTVSYTIGSDDYQIIVDWVAANDTLKDYVGYDNRREFYFGANAKYSDFNMYLGDRKGNDPNGYLDGLSDDEIKTVIYQRLIQAVQIVLEERFPTAVPFVNGVPVYYNVTFLTWDAGATDWYTIKYLCTETGKFEYVEGPTIVK